MKKNNNLKLIIIMEKKELYNGPQKAIYMDEEFQILLQTWGLHVPKKGNDSLIETDWCLFYISPIDKKILPVHQSLKALGATMENG